MHLRKIFAVLVTLSFVVSTHAASNFVLTAFDQGAGAQSAVVNNPVKEVNHLLTNLNRKVHSRMPASEKIEIVRKTISEIESLRKESPLQSIDKEISMDFAVDSLKHISDDKEFSVSKCADYKARVLIDFEPGSENRPSNPVLKRSFSIIEGVCS